MKRNLFIGLGTILSLPALIGPQAGPVSISQTSFSSAQAQDGQRGGRDDRREGRGPGRPGGMGGRMGDPGGAFRRSDKMQVGRFIREVGEMEKAKKTPLNKKQAQKIVATLAPWRKKASMNDAEAKKLLAALRDTLTAAQKKALDQRRPGGPGGPMGAPRDGQGPRGERRERPDGPPRGERPNGPPRGERGSRPDGPPPGGFGGPPGGNWKPPSEADMKKMQAFMAAYNPLYPPTSYAQVKALPQPMQEGMTRRYKELQAILSRLASKK